MSRLRDINDPRLSKNARKILRAALSAFADHHDVESAGVIELYEHGFIEMEITRDWMDKDAVCYWYQLPAEPSDSRDPVDTDYSGSADRKIKGSRIARSAIGNFDPMLKAGNWNGIDE